MYTLRDIGIPLDMNRECHRDNENAVVLPGIPPPRIKRPLNHHRFRRPAGGDMVSWPVE